MSDESVKSRLERVRFYAMEVFEDTADHWLDEPNRAFGGELPLNVAAESEEGEKRVMVALGRIKQARAYALEVFEDKAIAEEWLSTPNPVFGRDPILNPLNVAAESEQGEKRVMVTLGRIEHGVYT